MKKYVLCLILVMTVLSGCSLFSKAENTQPPVRNETPSKQESNRPKTTKPEYSIGQDNLNAQVKDWVYRYRRYDGVYLQKMGDYRYVLLTLGEKFGRGYDVKVKKVSKTQDKWVVEALFQMPTEENYAGQSIYPYEIVRIIDDGKPVEVINSQTGKTQPALKVVEIPEGRKLAVSKNFIVFTPLEGDKISSPVLIRGKARVFEATFRIHLEDGHKYLAEKVMMADQGAPAWGNFEVSLPFAKPTNPSGSVVLSYENMENGELIQELLVPVKFK